MSKVVVLTVLIASVIGQNVSDVGQSSKFPSNFLFGAGSAAYQIEGAWNEDGKGESGWDWCVHNVPGAVKDNSTADVACDSYHLYKEDIPYLKLAGMNTYRFSLSWPRLLPHGSTNNVNQKGVDYYNDLINEVLSFNMTPVVTMYHFDLPLGLVKLGGWTNDIVIDAFVSYAEFVLYTFGDRVKYWIPLNELNGECLGTYGSATLCPGLNMSGIADYICGHNKLLAHAQVYRRFELMPAEIKDGAMMGLSVACTAFYPWDTLNVVDYAAAEVSWEFFAGWFINPVFGTGGYPLVMREIVDFKSLQEGRKESRLPRFTPAQIALIKGSADFLGINQYTGQFSSFLNHCPDFLQSQLSPDSGVYTCPKPGYNMADDGFMQVVPGSMKDALTYIRVKYNNPPVMITENGYPDNPNENLIDNPLRQNFFQSVISDVMESIADGSNLLGYMVWSLLDSFEWNSGYTLKFGLVHVDFAAKDRTRKEKPIINFFKNVAEYGLNITSNT